MLTQLLETLTALPRRVMNRGDVGIVPITAGEPPSLTLTSLSSATALQHQPPIASQIRVRDFVDIELDVEGWYALGHHSPKAFLSVLSKHEPFERLRRNHVEHLWAIFDNNNFELFDEVVSGASPITLIRLF